MYGSSDNGDSPSVVVPVTAYGDFGDTGAALLLEDIGGKVPTSAYQQVFRSLGILHANNTVHGDPRLRNAVYVQ